MPAHNEHPGLPLAERSGSGNAASGEIYLGLVLDLSRIDLEEIATALADQNDYERHWLINPETGKTAFWTADTGIDGQPPVDLDELDLVVIDPLPTWVWYQDMADFAAGITNEDAGLRLARAIQGKEHSAASKTSSMRSTRTSCQRGTPSGMPVPGVAPCNGSPITPLIDDVHSAERFLSGTEIPPCPKHHEMYVNRRALMLQTARCRGVQALPMISLRQRAAPNGATGCRRLPAP